MRLIDADAMNEKLFYEEMGGKDTLITCEAAFDMIKAQPTVYDMDNVITELDEYLIKIVGRKSALYQTILHIVKRGGKNE